MSTAVSRSAQLEDWLDSLGGTEAGVIRLVNLYLLCSSARGPNLAGSPRLCPGNVLRPFLESCLRLQASKPAQSPLDTLKEAASAFIATDFARGWDPSSLARTPVLVTVMSSMTFHRRVLNPDFRGRLAQEPAWTINGEADYRRQLGIVTSHDHLADHWWGDTLGKPGVDPKLVWLTDRASLTRAVRAATGPWTRATRTRDILGLIHLGPGVYLLLLLLPITSLMHVGEFKMARPALAGMGHDRFAAHVAHKDNEKHYEGDWGVTVDLEKLSDPGRADTNGVPERVSPALPLVGLGPSVTVKGIGWVSSPRGILKAIDGHGAFADLLRANTPMDEIKDKLLEAVA
jgi:hypothetical protein